MIKWVQLCIVSLKVTKLPWHWGLTEPLFIVSHRKATGLWIWDVWEPYTITSEKIQNILIYGCKTNLIKTLFKKKKRTPYDKNASIAEKLAGLLERNSPTACRGIWEPLSLTQAWLATLEVGRWGLWKPGLSKRSSSFRGQSYYTSCTQRLPVASFHIVPGSSSLTAFRPGHASLGLRSGPGKELFTSQFVPGGE